MEWTDGERARLAAAAERNQRGGARRAILVVAVFGVVAIALGLLLSGRWPDHPAIWAAMFAPILVGVGIAFAGLRYGRRVRPPLVAGADRETRQAVQRAIRAGRSDDPRIDALVRDLQARSGRRTAVQAALFAATGLCLAVVVALSDTTVPRIVFAVAAVPQFVGAGLLAVQHRRLARYGA